MFVLGTFILENLKNHVILSNSMTKTDKIRLFNDRNLKFLIKLYQKVHNLITIVLNSKNYEIRFFWPRFSAEFEWNYRKIGRFSFKSSGKRWIFSEFSRQLFKNVSGFVIDRLEDDFEWIWIEKWKICENFARAEEIGHSRLSTGDSSSKRNEFWFFEREFRGLRLKKTLILRKFEVFRSKIQLKREYWVFWRWKKHFRRENLPFLNGKHSFW